MNKCKIEFEAKLTDSQLAVLEKHGCIRVEVPYEPGGESTFNIIPSELWIISQLERQLV
jgi:hypothetical protein